MTRDLHVDLLKEMLSHKLSSRRGDQVGTGIDLNGLSKCLNISIIDVDLKGNAVG
jgi:hypothetical protein